MLYIIPTVPILPSRKVSGPGASSFSWERSAHDRLSLWTEQEYGEIHSSVYRWHRYRRFLAVGCDWGHLPRQREQGKLLEGRLARARQAIRTRSRSTKYTEYDYGNIATTRFSYFTIATRNYWHALVFRTIRTWKISKIPPKSARTELPGHIKISILTKCGVRVVYPETVTYCNYEAGTTRMCDLISSSFLTGYEHVWVYTYCAMYISYKWGTMPMWWVRDTCYEHGCNRMHFCTFVS